MSDLKENIFKTIESKQIIPKSRWQFLVREYGVWSAIVISVVLGGAGIGVLLYVVANSDLGYIQVIGFPSFVLGTMSVWLFVTSALLFLAYWQFEHTKFGYRHSLPAILLSVTMVAFIFGGVVHVLGMGKLLDQQAAYWAGSMYETVDQKRERFWQRPHEGQLVGRLSASGSELILHDPTGQRWLLLTPVATSNLPALDVQPRVVVTGTRVSSTTFEACALRLWKERGAKMMWHKDEANEMLVRIAQLLRIEKC